MPAAVDLADYELDGPYRTPTRRDRRREFRAGLDLARLLYRSPQLLSAAQGDDQVLVMAPGFATDDLALAPLRYFLRRAGHDARGWGIGRNTGDVEDLLDKLTVVCDRAANESGRPVNLVGWSLGGVVAREVARDRPDLIDRVATFGTPLRGPRYTSGAGFYPTEEIERIEQLITERDRRPIDRPVLAIFSRNDGIVDWRTCPDRQTPGVVNVELNSSHVGLGVDPDLWLLLADWFSADDTLMN